MKQTANVTPGRTTLVAKARANVQGFRTCTEGVSAVLKPDAAASACSTITYAKVVRWRSILDAFIPVCIMQRGRGTCHKG